ncbi:hypothetical protein GS507_25225 [Rhodococcus hoagii]|nr:hypothetical protein [Prescottella equi]
MIDQRLISLVGAGDSTKTTLLDAIGLVLSPNYSPQFTDADFFRLELTKSIVIEATITNLPDNLVKESQLGKDRSGILSDGTLVHDPVEEAEECLVVRLTVTPELDPTWEVVRPDCEDARSISASQRRQLGFFRLGERADFHLRWARGSALSGLTDGGDGLRLSFSMPTVTRGQQSSMPSRARYTMQLPKFSGRPGTSVQGIR